MAIASHETLPVGTPGEGLAGLPEVPVLSLEQAGHLRHIDNLSRLPRGDWRLMAPSMPLQEDFSAYRYQLGYMSMALGLAHMHRLPAAPVVFQRTLDRLIHKMLEVDTWWYWRDTSTSGGYGPLDLPRLPSRTDPVAVDNIMYSAYLQVMTLQYTMLFDDRTYEQPDSLSFDVYPVLWGRDRREVFQYDQRSLNERIYWSMVSNGYLGVACEPFCVFQMCNQVPILGFRLHDHIYGGDTATEVTEGYVRAWEDFGGGFNERGHFIKNIIQRNEMLPKDYVVDNDSAWTDGWLGMLMNMWRPELIHRTYRDKIGRWVEPTDAGTLTVTQVGMLPDSQKIQEPGGLGELGWLAGWASEMGDEEVLSGLLAHADTFMNPQWENGGLYYPRRDDAYDEAGRFVAMPPITSNAMLPYARLNVADGLRKLYEQPWTERERSRPALTGLSDGVDVRRAWYDEHTKSLQLAFSAMHGSSTPNARLTVSRLGTAPWTLFVDRVPVATGHGGTLEPAEGADRFAPRTSGDAVELTVPLDGELTAVDIVWGIA